MFAIKVKAREFKKKLLKEGFVDVSPLSENCAPNTQKAIDAVKQMIISGEWDVFSGVKLEIAADGTGHDQRKEIPLHGKAHRLHAGKIHPQHSGKYPPAQTANDHVEKIQQDGGQKIPVIKIPETLHDGFFLA